MKKKKKTPSLETPNTTPPIRSLEQNLDAEYSQVLGRFVEDFAALESTVFTYHALCAHVTIPIARAVFSGLKSDAAIQNIRRLWRIEPPIRALREELEDVFLHFQMVNDFRNLLLHYGSTIREFAVMTSMRRITSGGDARVTDDGSPRHVMIPVLHRERFSSDAAKALTNEVIRERRVTVSDLDGWCFDTLKINSHLLSLCNRPTASLAERASRPLDVLTAAWQHMSAQNQPDEAPKSSKSERKAERKRQAKRGSSPPSS